MTTTTHRDTIETVEPTPENPWPVPPPPVVEPRHREEALSLPFTTRFELGARITPVQQAFLDEHGFILFGGFLDRDRVDEILESVDAVQERWLSEGREKINGIPVFVGRDEEGRPFIQRFAFTSFFSEPIRAFIDDPALAPICSLVGEDARIGHREKDGVVFNRNLNVPGSAYRRLGWHTDGLRALAYLRLPGPMLNIGVHFDRIEESDGGLRLIPGSHRQNLWSMCTRKLHFFSQAPDRDEVMVSTEPGDLTVHDGRMWHRVALSTKTGRASLRRTMYLPILTDAYQPKDEESSTPAYHSLGIWLRRLRLMTR